MSLEPVFNGLFESDDCTGCSIGPNLEHLQINVLTGLALPLTLHLSNLLDVDALNKLLEVAADLLSQTLANFSVRFKVTSWSFRWSISLKANRRYRAELFTEASFTLTILLCHWWQPDVFGLFARHLRRHRVIVHFDPFS